MKNFIVCTHGPTAAAMLTSVKMIAGDQPYIKSICFKDGEDLKQLKKDLQVACNQFENKNIGFLVDVQGGTPFNTIVQMIDQYPNSYLITGVNIPMLLEIAVNRGDELSINHLQKIATNAIKCFNGVLTTNSEDEEF